MNFRGDIQILRGVSVLLVVLFHLGINSFQSGFLGVDVFFVISGFLMAVLYDHNDKMGFFKRRALRLLPAYYVVIAFTVLFSALFTTRNETVQVFEQAYIGSVFASNIGFWSQTSYFSTSEFNPLLHLWSLGVEIQFYLVVPLLALFFRKSKWLLVLIGLVSFLLCLWATTISPKTSFFITPFRIWEFLIGYGAALFFTSGGNLKTSSNNYYGFLGLLALLVVPLLPVDGQSLSFITGHPGLFAFLVATATALVLVFGLPDFVEKSLVGKGLFVLGKYSYSIYLVHFPIIVIYNSEPFSGTKYGSDSILDLIILAVAICVASMLLYRGVERRKLPFPIVKMWMPAVSFASVLIVAITASISFVQYRSLDAKDHLIFGAERDRSVYRCGKIFRVLNPGEPVCELTGLSKEDAFGGVMLAGNSHADSVKEAFRVAAKEANLNLYFFVSNSTMNHNGPSPKFIVQQAVKNNVSSIFVHQFSSSFRYEFLSEVVSEAQKRNIEVVYLEPVPVWGEQIPKAMWTARSHKNKDSWKEKDVSDYYSENEEIFEGLDQINFENFSRIAVVDAFCDPACKFKSENGAPLYFDSHHLTKTGGEVLYPIIAKELSNLAKIFESF